MRDAFFLGLFPAAQFRDAVNQEIGGFNHPDGWVDRLVILTQPQRNVNLTRSRHS